jgi:hypothetical protein
MEQELRAYFFQNMYLQGIHAGIQSQHCTAEMFCKYSIGNDLDQPMARTLYAWATFHKTTIVLNGGDASNLKRIATLLDSHPHNYPWTYFEESEEALGGCITNVGIILPEKIFNHFSSDGEIVECPYSNTTLTEFEINLAMEVSQCRLMS